MRSAQFWGAMTYGCDGATYLGRNAARTARSSSLLHCGLSAAVLLRMLDSNAGFWALGRKMKLLPLVWSNCIRNRTRLIFTLIAVVSAFALYGMLAAIGDYFVGAGPRCRE